MPLRRNYWSRGIMIHIWFNHNPSSSFTHLLYRRYNEPIINRAWYFCRSGSGHYRTDKHWKKMAPIVICMGLPMQISPSWQLRTSISNTSLGDTRNLIPPTPSQASIILGLWIDPNGSSLNQTKRLRILTSAWSDRVRSGHIIRTEVCYYFQTTVNISL